MESEERWGGGSVFEMALNEMMMMGMMMMMMMMREKNKR